jgi:hypothetical protein
MNDQINIRKLLDLLTEIDTLEDFIKICYVDGKLDKQAGNEILRLIKEMKTRALN